MITTKKGLILRTSRCLLMDYKRENDFQELIRSLEKRFGEGLDLNAIILLIGVQELGQGYKDFSKDEKINLMHIAICTVLEPYGFYKFIENDEDGWPHFERERKIPALTDKEQEFMIKEAVLNYFEGNQLLERINPSVQ